MEDLADIPRVETVKEYVAPGNYRYGYVGKSHNCPFETGIEASPGAASIILDKHMREHRPGRS